MQQQAPAQCNTHNLLVIRGHLVLGQEAHAANARLRSTGPDGTQVAVSKACKPRFNRLCRRYD